MLPSAALSLSPTAWVPPALSPQPSEPDPRNPGGVLLLNEAFYPLMDGVINVVDNLYHSLYQRGIHTHIATPTMPGYVDTHKRISRLPSAPMVFARPYRWPLSCRAAKYLPSDLASNIDIVHLHSAFANARSVMRWARTHKKPVVLTVHTKYQDKFKGTLGPVIGSYLYWKLLLTINAADIVTCPGQLFYEQLLKDGVNPAKLRVVRNGVSDWPETTLEDRIRVLQNDPLSNRIQEAKAAGKSVFLFVGQQIREKNPSFLLDALDILKKQGRGFLCLFVGGGDQSPWLEKKARRLGLQDDVVFVGRVMDRVRLSMMYALSDLMTFPSTFETSGLVVMEAAQHQLPTVGITGSSGVSEIVRDGDNGFLAPLVASQYARRIREAMDDKLAMRRIRARAAQTIARDKLDMVDDFLAIYRELIPQRLALSARKN